MESPAHSIRPEPGDDPVLETTSVPCFFFSSRRRHTIFDCDWSSDVCSSDLATFGKVGLSPGQYVWAGKVAAGDTRIIVDLVTQTMYVYRGEELLGASSMSSAKKIGRASCRERV